MSRKTLLLQSALCATAIGGAFLAGRATAPSVGSPSFGFNSRGAFPLAAPAPGSNLVPKTSDSASAGALAAGAAGARPPASSPEQATTRLKAILENQDPVSRMTDFLALLKTLDTNEAWSAALAGLMENFNPRERARELNMLMSVWASADPEAALASVKDDKDWTGKMAASTVLAKWAGTNPDAAIAWATENGKEANATDNGNFYMAGLVGGLAKIDLDRAALLAQTGMNRSRARGEAMERVLDQYQAQRSPEATQQWAASLEAGPFKDGVFKSLAGRMASKDGPSAAAWATSLPDTENKPQVLAEIVDRWSRDQPNEAGAWLNQFPASTATDSPRETFAWQVQKKDPEAAMAWAGTITDEKRREHTTNELIKTWAQREPDAARQWVDANANLSQQVKTRFGTKPTG